MTVMRHSRSRHLTGAPGRGDPWVVRVQDERWSEGASVRFTRRHNCVLLLVTAGRGVLVAGDRAQALGPRSVAALVPGEPHRVESDLSRPLATLRLVLAGKDPEAWIRQRIGDPSHVWLASPDVREAFHRIVAEAARQTDDATEVAGHWLALLATALRRNQGGFIDDGGPAQRAHALLHRDPCQPSGLAELARACAVSPEHLCRVFTARYGEPPARCAQRLRRAEAEDLLADGTRTLADIAHALGFSDVSAFGKAFRRWSGCSPAKWRRQCQA